MKVVLCANTSWYLYNYRKNLISAIQQHDHIVYAIAPSDQYSSKLRNLGVDFFHLKLHPTSKNFCREWLSLIDLFFLLKKLEPDFVLTFTAKCNLYTGFVNKVLPFSQLANISGLGELFDQRTCLTPLIMGLYKLALRNARKIFFQNEEDLQTFLQQKILPTYICRRIPGSGIDLTKFKPAPQKKSLKSNGKIFLMFGRVLPRKRYDLFLEAAKSLMEEGDKNSAFWVLGMRDGLRKDSEVLFQQIQKYHTEKIITYFPQTDDVLQFIRQADVVVLPSQYNEGVPRSLLEAMACGKPIITTAWKGCRDTVEHGINGLLIEKGNLKALKEAMSFFIHSDAVTLKKMGQSSRLKAEKEFDEQFVLSQYLAEISSLQ